MSKLQDFKFRFGYVESLRLSSLEMNHEVGFDTVPDALDSVKAVLLAHVIETHQGQPCCLKAPNGSNFCPTCGFRIYNEPSPADVVGLFDKLFTMDIDIASSLGIWDRFEEAGWRLGYLESKNVVTVEKTEAWFDREPGERMPFIQAYLPDGKSWTPNDGA